MNTMLYKLNSGKRVERAFKADFNRLSTWLVVDTILLITCLTVGYMWIMKMIYDMVAAS